MMREFRIILVTAVFLLAALGMTPVIAQQILTKDNEKIDFARGLQEQSMFALAAVQYEEFVQQFPQSTFLEDAYMGAAESRFFLKEYEKARDSYQKVIDLFPTGKNRDMALVRIGQCYYLLGKKDEAIAWLNQANAANLTPPFVQTLYFFSGQSQAAKGNAQEAATFFSKAAQVPEATAYTAQAYFYWASALSTLGQYPAALETTVKAMELATTDDFKAAILMKQGEINFLAKDFVRAAESFRKVVETYPSLPMVPDAAANWFAALLNLKQYDELIAQYNQRFRSTLQPAYTPLHLSAAKAMVASGRYDEGLVVLDALLSRPELMTEPQKAKTYLQKCDLLVRAARFAEAVACIDGQMATAGEGRSAMLLLKAQSHIGLKEFDKAFEVYQMVITEFPNTPAGLEATCGLGHTRYNQGQNEEAAKHFTECFNKTADETARAEAFYFTFLAYEKGGLTDKAIETGEAYLRDFSKGANLLDVGLILSGLYTKAQQYKRSIEILTPLTTDTDETRRLNAHFQIAYNHQLSGEADEALAGYEKVIAEHKNPDQLYYLSLKNSFIIYLQKKDEVKAAHALDRAIREFENNDIPLKNYLWLAEYFESKNDPNAMAAVLKGASRIHSASPGAIGIRYLMAQAQRLQSDCPQAILTYDEVIAAPDNVGYKGRAHLGKALCLAPKGDMINAQVELENAISVNPEDNFVAMRSRFEQARNAELQQKHEDAAKLYMIVAVLYKDPYFSPEALLRAGGLFQQINQGAEAMNAYKQIISGYPKSPQAVTAQDLASKIEQ